MAKQTKDETNVTRITASDNGSSKRTKTAKADKTKGKALSKEARRTEESTSRSPLKAFLDYFSGAWYELRQVRWPTRAATWGLTGAVLLFSAFFVVFILLIDAGFKFVFEQLLK